MSSTEKPSSSNSIDQRHPPKALLEEFDRAMSLRNTNRKKAMSIVESMCAKYGEFHMAHYCRGNVLAAHACSLNSKANNKTKLLNNALESLQKSMSMYPTPGCSHLMARVLYEMANDDEGYAKVIQECKRGLSMAKSIVIIKNDATNGLQQLMKLAKAGQKRKNQRSTKHDSKAAILNVSSTDHSEVSREEEKSNQEFVKRVGDYWRNLHYYKKCRMMQVKVANLEGLFLSEKYRNLWAVNITKEAIDSYRKKRHWMTWSCCLCEVDKNEGKYKNWSSIERHIDMHHFHGTPKVEGSIKAQLIISSFDVLELDYHNYDADYTSEIFKIDLARLVGRIDSDPVVNNKFLTNWLRKDDDLNKALESWEKRKVSRREMGIKVSEQVAKEMQESAANSQGSPSNKHKKNVANIIAYKQEAVRLSAYDYREALMPILKVFIQGRLDCGVENARAKADAAMAELLNEVGLDKENESNTSRKKKGKQKEKGTGSSEQASQQSQISITNKYFEHEDMADSLKEEMVAGVENAESKLEEESDYQLGRIPFGTTALDIFNHLNRRNIGE